MKLDQKVCLVDILDEFENASYGVKNEITRSNFRKPLVCFSGHIFCPILLNLGQNFYRNDVSGELKNRGHVGSKTMLLCQILEKSYLRCNLQRPHILLNTCEIRLEYLL